MIIPNDFFLNAYNWLIKNLCIGILINDVAHLGRHYSIIQFSKMGEKGEG